MSIDISIREWEESSPYDQDWAVERFTIINWVKPHPLMFKLERKFKDEQMVYYS